MTIEKVFQTDSLIPGSKFLVRVRGIRSNGTTTPWSESYNLNVRNDTSAPPDITSLVLQFISQSVSATWDGTDAKAVQDFRHFEITISSDDFPGVSETVFTTNESYELDINKNRSIFGAAASSITLTIKSVDLTGNKSTGVSSTAENSPPADPTNVVAESKVLGYNVSWDFPAELDYDYTNIYESDSLGGTYSVVAKVYGSTAFIPSVDFTPRYIKISHVDFFGLESNLVSSAPTNVTPQNPVGTDTSPPSDPTGLAFESSVLNTEGGITTASVRAYWQISDFSTTGYKVRTSRNQENWEVNDIPATRANVTYKEISSNVATLTVESHSFSVGDWVVVNGVDATFDGSHKITAVTGTSISYALVSSDLTQEASSGLIILTSYVIPNLITGTTYYASILAYDEVNNLTQFVSEGTFTTGGSTPSIGTPISVDGPLGTMKFGPDAGGSGNDGLYIDSDNFWYDTGSFSLGTSTNSVTWDGVKLRIDGDLRARSGVFSGNVAITSGALIAAASLTITNATWASNVATFTTSGGHGWTTGDSVVVSETSSGFDGNYSITGTPSSTQFTVSLVPTFGSSIAPVSSGKVARVNSGARTVFNSNGIASYNSSNGAEFILTNAGTNYIAGWSLTSTTLSSESISLNSSTGRITSGNSGISGEAVSESVPNPIRFWAGTTAPSTSAPFYVTNNGNLVATSATISGAITATSGTFSGTINASGGTFSGYLQGGISPYFRVGQSVNGSNNGIYFSTGDYWYSSGNFQFGGSTGFVKNGTSITIGSSVSVNGNISGATGTFTGALSVGTTDDNDSTFSVDENGYMIAHAAKFKAYNADADTYAIRIQNGGNIELLRSAAGSDNKIIWLGSSGSKKVGIEYDASESQGLLLKANYDGSTTRPITLTNPVTSKRQIAVWPDSNTNEVATNIYRRSSNGPDTLARWRSNYDGESENIVCEILVNGALRNETGSYGTLSDERLKRNIEPARDYLSDLMSINVIKYQLLGDSGDSLLGFSAQQVQTIFPGLVETDDEGYLSVKTSIFIPMLLTAVQELSDRVQYLEGRMEQLGG